eukprot:CAMPEP_0114297856 /NCGR_PEP_ID=MMETSP0059-20121206/12095_1 /TAXON_ID=36894 /ORGANISM="Pyramimonas parkeae, Strain CCMP726" /LENGTH=239 /DNA_ID=CAMNT_0001420153 /DNA_START=77 /DNA_END=796 /DNA_ORIENTATION=+
MNWLFKAPCMSARQKLYDKDTNRVADEDISCFMEEQEAVDVARAELPLPSEQLETLVDELRQEVARLKTANTSLMDDVHRKEVGLARFMKDAEARECALQATLELYNVLKRDNEGHSGQGDLRTALQLKEQGLTRYMQDVSLREAALKQDISNLAMEVKEKVNLEVALSRKDVGLQRFMEDANSREQTLAAKQFALEAKCANLTSAVHDLRVQHEKQRTGLSRFLEVFTNVHANGMQTQ